MAKFCSTSLEWRHGEVTLQGLTTRAGKCAGKCAAKCAGKCAGKPTCCKNNHENEISKMPLAWRLQIQMKPPIDVLKAHLKATPPQHFPNTKRTLTKRHWLILTSLHTSLYEIHTPGGQRTGLEVGDGSGSNGRPTLWMTMGAVWRRDIL